ncbi:MAG: hypothetical protein H0T84_10790 [Tatlockia sp.]|nr:hypothetical protein [Tatlockia sp.]
MTVKRLALIIGILTVGISLATWAFDLAHLTIQCIYCRSERTAMGLLGILLLIPVYPYLTRYFAYVFGFFGASVAAQQSILIMEHSGLMSFKFLLVVAVFFIIIGQVFLIILLDKEQFE